MKVKNKNDHASTSPIFMLPIYQALLDEKKIDGSFDHVGIAGGVNVPEDGFNIHDQDELSTVIESYLEIEIENEIYNGKAGDCALIRKGVPHISKNLNENRCKIISLLM